MNRIVKNRTILLFLLLLFTFPSMTHNSEFVQEMFPVLVRCIKAESGPILSYTANDVPVPILLYSGDYAAGDHVILNVTVPNIQLENSTILKVKSFALNLTSIVGYNQSISTNGTTLLYDTYTLMRNMTVSLHLNITTLKLTLHTFDYYNITFENFFQPQISQIDVIRAGVVKTISWTIFDKNVNDEHFCEFLLSMDYGASFMLISKNITDASYVWDSTGWIYEDYIIQIRVSDNDPDKNPMGIQNGVYWPGLTSSKNGPLVRAGSKDDEPSISYITWDSTSTYIPDTTKLPSDSTSTSLPDYSATSTLNSISTTIATSTSTSPSLNTTEIFQILSLVITVTSIGVIVIFSVLLVLNRINSGFKGE